MSLWLLPESIADVLPSEARRIEELRRKVLDLFHGYGYELVMPPLLEYTDSLLANADETLDLKTFKLLDQASGRLLGLRADTTPQVARIDAHILNRAGMTRLCYCGPVLHTQAVGLRATREPLQCGAELYGAAGPEADLEMLALAIDTLETARITGFRLALSHAGLVPALLQGLPIRQEARSAIHQALAQKSPSALQAVFNQLPQHSVPAGIQQALLQLMMLNGIHHEAAKGVGDAAQQDVLGKAADVFRAILPDALPNKTSVLAVLQGLTELVNILPKVVAHLPPIVIDLADVATFDYHSGVLFAAFVPGCPNAVLRGGRYDDVGEVYGRARAATGFSVDLRELVALSPSSIGAKSAIAAPWLPEDAQLADTIRALRMAGEVVMYTLPNSAVGVDEFICDRQLQRQGPEWVVVPLSV